MGRVGGEEDGWMVRIVVQGCAGEKTKLCHLQVGAIAVATLVLLVNDLHLNIERII